MRISNQKYWRVKNENENSNMGKKEKKNEKNEKKKFAIETFWKKISAQEVDDHLFGITYEEENATLKKKSKKVKTKKQKKLGKKLKSWNLKNIKLLFFLFYMFLENSDSKM